MPSWCITQYTINGEKKEIDSLWNALKEAKESARIKTDFGEDWLGHILTFLGMDDDSVTTGNIACRGCITYEDKTDPHQITLDTETAWAPMPQPIVMLCKKYAPNAEIVYQAVEPSCGVYLSNDPAIYNHFWLDVMDFSSIPPEFKEYDNEFFNKDGLKFLLSKVFGHDGDLHSLLRETEEKWLDRLSIIKFDFAELTEL